MRLADWMLGQEGGNRDSSGNRFAHHPVHALTHNRRTLEIGGVDEAGSAVYVPSISHGALKQAYCSLGHPRDVVAWFALLRQCSMRLDKQASPL